MRESTPRDQIRHSLKAATPCSAEQRCLPSLREAAHTRRQAKAQPTAATATAQHRPFKHRMSLRGRMLGCLDACLRCPGDTRQSLITQQRALQAFCRYKDLRDLVPRALMHYKHFTQGGNHVPSFLAPAIPPAPEQESWCGTFLLCQAPEIDHVDDPAKHQTIHVAGPLQAFLHCKPLCQTCRKNQKLPQRSCTQEALAES